MIKKDLFVKTINFLKKKDDFQIKLNDMINEEFGECVFYPYDDHVSVIVKLLSASFDYDDDIIKDWIDYYIYEMCYGANWEPGAVTEIIKGADGNDVEVDIPLKTPEDLYNMLFKTACGYKVLRQNE